MKLEPGPPPHNGIFDGPEFFTGIFDHLTFRVIGIVLQCRKHSQGENPYDIPVVFTKERNMVKIGEYKACEGEMEKQEELKRTYLTGL